MKKVSPLHLNFVLIFILILALISQNNLFLIVIGLLATVPVIIGAVKSLSRRHITVDLLASIALIASLLHRDWASAAFINLMITSARVFAIYTENRAKQAIQSLLKLKPETVKVKESNRIIELPIKSIRVNQTILIETGDRIPVDGIVISGYASLDQSSLTGESLPIAKKTGDRVFTSTLNLSGTILVRAQKVGKDTGFEKIITLMQQAQDQKIGIKSLIDKFTTWYILATLLVVFILFLTSRNLPLILAVLLVTCADDIAVAIPLTYWAAIARSASRGVIIKGSNYLESLTKITTLIVDKTGTLTRGQIRVLHLFLFDKHRPTDTIKEAASLASVSSHPISQALVRFATEHRFSFPPPKDFHEIPGYGITAHDHLGNLYALGNAKLMRRLHLRLDSRVRSHLQHIENEGHNFVLLSKNHRLIALFGLGDQLRLGVKTALDHIRRLGINDIIMLTGDNDTVARDIASQIGIDHYYSGLLPQDKLTFIKKLQKKSPRSSIAFVGDGVNDAAALAQADIGIAMGAIGSDAAIESADITLMDDNFSKIYGSLKLSLAVAKIVKEDFAIWGLVNLIGLWLVFALHISPQTAAAYNFGTDFIPLLNSVRIFRYRFSL
jgi:heavy metal translocating P-type ATPase